MKSNINFNIHELINKPEFIYVLGLLWADGNVFLKKSQYKRQVTINMLSTDILEIIPIFQSFATWYQYNFIPSGYSPKQQTRLGLTSQPFCEFLLENHYQCKSYKSADKILNLIPDNLKYYWFRGLSDGDGCFYFNDKYKTSKHTFSITSHDNQDWTYMINLSNFLHINYHISHFTNKYNTNGSSFRISSTKNIIKLGDFLYQNYSTDKIGLSRKFNKFIQIKNEYLNKYTT